MTDSQAADANATLDPRAGDARWTWARGGSASVASIDGDGLVVHSTVAFPPGAPLVALSDNRVTFEMKVRTCRKLATGAFEIAGKLVNATRPLREQLIAAVAARNVAQR
jgi:hypothetical protein